MNWQVEYEEAAKADLKKLDATQQMLVLKGIRKVSQNPLPQSEGGYGKPLGNHSDTRLAGLMKIKFRDAGLRVVYRVIRTETTMKIIVISVRDDEAVYKLAAKRMGR